MYLDFNSKQAKPNGDIIEIRIWRTNPDTDYPEGIRYSFVYIRSNKRLLGYDNYHGKGHHRHIKEREEKYEFVGEWQLLEDFSIDIEKIARGVIK